MYLKTAEKIVNFDNELEVSSAYEAGFVFTRLGKGVMNQTRSLRIDLSKFELTSENKRILRKTESLRYHYETLPLQNYSWEIHKLGKDYYERKFGVDVMSASKIKNMFVHPEDNNMNAVFRYETENGQKINDKNFLGFALCYQNARLLHYAYPFYNLESGISNLGMGMMLHAIMWSQKQSLKYVYLGSAVEQSAKYKLQFEGIEWWDTNQEKWSSDVGKLKLILEDSTAGL